jgi:methionyl-tRNA formyltransferase
VVTPPVKALAEAHGIPVMQPEKVRTPEFADQVRSLSPDLIVTAAYGRILPAHILAIPPRGCLNVHASLLPAYRGAAPIQWSIIRGEKETGVTIMLMDEGMDTGDILMQRRLPISEEIDAEQLSRQLAQLGAAMLPEAIQGWLDGSLIAQKQDSLGPASQITPLSREIGQINWLSYAGEIHDLIRGLYPWPGAYTSFGRKRLKVHRARICRDTSILSQAAGMAPGSICATGPDSISVVCGDGVLDLLEIQTDAGKRMLCRDCGHNYQPGLMMGDDDDV